jgi:fatty acid desaturase
MVWGQHARQRAGRWSTRGLSHARVKRVVSRSTSSPRRDQLDPVLVHARREALVILAAFAVCLVWSVGWCYLAGYHEPAGSGLSTVLGMPSWVFWGVLVPWLAADVFALWFCFFFVAADPLGESEDERGEADGPAERLQTGEEDRHD